VTFSVWPFLSQSTYMHFLCTSPTGDLLKPNHANINLRKLNKLKILLVKVHQCNFLFFCFNTLFNFYLILVARRGRVRSNHQLAIDARAQVDVLADGQAEHMFRGGQCETESPGVVAQNLLVDEFESILSIGILQGNGSFAAAGEKEDRGHGHSGEAQSQREILKESFEKIINKDILQTS